MYFYTKAFGNYYQSAISPEGTAEVEIASGELHVFKYSGEVYLEYKPVGASFEWVEIESD